jgi:hypothetical protein
VTGESPRLIAGRFTSQRIEWPSRSHPISGLIGVNANPECHQHAVKRTRCIVEPKRRTAQDSAVAAHQAVRGRNFLPGDEGVAIVDEATARMLWPDQDALGHSLPWDPDGQTVIGIVRNASTGYVGNPEPLEFYVPPSPTDAPADGHRYLRSGRGESVHAIAAIAILGAVAILLSVIGLAGLAGYTVAQRTREIGLRIALGARASHVVRAILAPMGRPIVSGCICGALGGSAVAIVLRSGIPTMAGIDVLDPLPYVTAMAFFAAVIALAILALGRRAMRINPSQALQHE